MQKLPAINLAKGRNDSLVDKIIAWALSVGRLVVILTEAIALTTFLMRFSFDGQIIDLHSKIKAKQNIVQAYADQEVIYRNLQDRLTNIQQLETQAPDITTFLQSVIQSAPPDVAITDISISQDSLKLEALFQSSASLSTFVNKFQQNPLVSAVSIDNVENKTTAAVIKITLTAKLKK